MSSNESKNYELDVNQIQEIIAHRYPFLLVDRILKIEDGKKVTGLKNVTFNEPHFMGHFPNHPIMPGVLILEAMAQTGAVLLKNLVPDFEKKLVYFAAIDNAKFKKPVVPGDQLIFEVELVNFRRGICKLVGKSFVDGNLVSQADFTAAVIDR
ncbi:MAG: 3-hydroxyacyl-[acyl-carrier-protein] dehydratase FabZ [Calditrichaeota bacterium]|nr:MAG: 3-hydroxyacyl-[acyl-carrier-protein] dehydratase FabZ [Calditrichota bacterium]